MAPVSLFGLSPALLMVMLGIDSVQLFVSWAHRRQARQQTPLLTLEVVDLTQELSAQVSMMATVVPGNVLVETSPKALAGDVGSLRGTVVGRRGHGPGGRARGWHPERQHDADARLQALKLSFMLTQVQSQGIQY